MKLTDQQRIAVDYPGHAVITACPGSGKTRTLIAKVLKCIDELSGSPRKVACITYTNTAVHEIENRIRQSGAPVGEGCHEVSTIHAFCQINILGRYHWLTEEYKGKYVVLPPDHDVYSQIVAEVSDQYGLNDFARSQFEMLSRRSDGSPGSGSVPAEAAIEFWNRLKSEGYIDFCSIIYYSYKIIRDHPTIAHNLSCRFAYILVDEFQDTSELQVELLKLLYKEGHTTFFLVGDPEQSIYSFAGAQRELMESFSQMIEAQDFPVMGNFRSTKALVDAAELLITRNPPMISVSSRNQLASSVFYEHTQDALAAMTDYFLPFLEVSGISYGNAAILAPQWPLLRPLGKELRGCGIPVVGPGARPYKRKYLLGRIAEQVCAYLAGGGAETLRQAEKELFAIASELSGRPAFRIFSYDGMRAVHRLMHVGKDLSLIHKGAVEWLYEVAVKFEEILTEEGVVPIEHSGCLVESFRQMVDEMERLGIAVSDMTLGDLGILADPRKSIKLMTMHSAKGREFEAVAIINAHDGIIPFYNQNNQLTDAKLEESRRLFYVAMTRAERALWIFSSPNSRGFPPTRFLSEIGLS